MSDTATTADTASKLDYAWIDTPPIVHVPNDQVAGRVATFRTNLQTWGTVGGGTSLADRLDIHAGGADHIAGLVIKDVDPMRAVFEYKLAGAPVGFLMLDLSGRIMEIKNLTTHPGAENAGGILIEYALNRVQRLNSIPENTLRFPAGVLCLESYNAASTAAYLALGFETRGKGMLLDANASDKWVLVGEQWKLRKFQAMKYLGRQPTS